MVTPIDLHVHSTSSDGTFTPSELVSYALKKGLTAFALTDHDTVDGIDEAMAAAKAMKENTGEAPQVIPGIEFSTDWEGTSVHVVGLFIRHNDPVFAGPLQTFIDSRTTRNHKICEKLRAHGIDITYDALLEMFPGAVITRAHYAKFMLAKGFIKEIKEAFEKYIGDGCPCYVEREKITPHMAVELILQGDGVPILAHPILYHLPDAKLEQLVAELKAVGLMGIEAVYSSYTLDDERKIRRLAAKYHLQISGGSDFHGSNKPGLDLGTGYGHLFVPSSLLDEINACRKNILFTDLDGTLLLEDSTISPAMSEGIANMSAAGHKLVLTSGRSLPSVLEVKENAGLHFKNMYVIAFNGSVVYDCDAKEKILQRKIEPEWIKKIESLARNFGVHMHAYTDDEIIAHEMDEEMRFYKKRIHQEVICTKDIAATLPDGTYKILFISLTDHEKLEDFRQALRPILPIEMPIIFSNDYYLEVLPANSGKGAAASFLTDYLHFSRRHTYAAGDAENDLSMIEAAHVGIAMANGDEIVKKAAQVITKKSNQEDGLLEIIETFR